MTDTRYVSITRHELGRLIGEEPAFVPWPGGHLGDDNIMTLCSELARRNPLIGNYALIEGRLREIAVSPRREWTRWADELPKTLDKPVIGRTAFGFMFYVEPDLVDRSTKTIPAFEYWRRIRI